MAFGRKKKEPQITDPVAMAMQQQLREQQEVEEAFRKGITALRDFIAPSSLELQSSHFQLGTRYARSYYVFGYPRQIFTGWLSGMINLDEIRARDALSTFAPAGRGGSIADRRALLAYVDELTADHASTVATMLAIRGQRDQYREQRDALKEAAGKMLCSECLHKNWPSDCPRACADLRALLGEKP